MPRRSEQRRVTVTAPVEYPRGSDLANRDAALWTIEWDQDGNLTGRTSRGLRPDARPSAYNSRNRSGVELALAQEIIRLQRSASGARTGVTCTGPVMFGGYMVEISGLIRYRDGDLDAPSVAQLRGSGIRALRDAGQQVRRLRELVALQEREIDRLNGVVAVEPADPEQEPIAPTGPDYNSQVNDALNRAYDRMVATEDGLPDWERDLLTPSPVVHVGAVVTPEMLDTLPDGTVIHYGYDGRWATAQRCWADGSRDRYVRVGGEWYFANTGDLTSRPNLEQVRQGQWFVTELPAGA